MLRRTLLCCLVAAVGLMAGTYARGDENCDASTANRVAKAIFRVGDWPTLYKFYDKYGACDVDTVALGFTDRTSDMLANNWDTLPILADQAVQHPGFDKYVLAHLNRDVAPTLLKTIRTNAEQHCPADQTALCSLITERINKILPY